MSPSRHGLAIALILNLILMVVPGVGLAQPGPVADSKPDQSSGTAGVVPPEPQSQRQPQPRLRNAEIRSAVWTRDEKFFAAVVGEAGSLSARDLSVVLWNVGTGRVVDRIRFPEIGYGTDGTSIFVNAMAVVANRFTNDFGLMISTSLKNPVSGTCSNLILNSFFGSDSKSWRPDNDINTPGSCIAAKSANLVSPSGKLAVSANRRGLAFFRPGEREPVRLLEGPNAFPGGDEPMYFARIGDAISQRYPEIVLQTQSPADEAKLALWTPDEKLVVAVIGAKGSVATRDHSLVVWDFRNGDIVNRVEFPDLGSNSSIYIHNIYISRGSTAELRASLQTEDGPGCESIILTYKFDQQSGWTRKADLNRPALCVVEYPPNPASPSGNYALSETQSPLAVLHPGTGKTIAALDKPEALVIADAALSPDGNTMALVAGRTEGPDLQAATVIVFDLRASRIKEISVAAGIAHERVEWLDDRQFVLLSRDRTGPTQTFDAQTGRAVGSQLSDRNTAPQEALRPGGVQRLFTDPDGYFWADYDKAAGAVYGVTVQRGVEKRTTLGQNIVAGGKFPGSPLFWFATKNAGLLWLSAPTNGSFDTILPVTYFFKGGKFFTKRRFGYDTNLPADTGLFRWVKFGDGMKTLGPQTYLRTSFQPQLARRMIECERTQTCKEAFKAAFPRYNTTLPIVTIDRVTPGSEPNTAVVEITVREVKGAGRPGYDDSTGAYNVRLFRNGSLVAQFPQVDGLGDSTDIAVWRERNLVTPGPDGTRHLSLRVMLPTATEAQTIALTAYAFNEDRIKSETARADYDQPAVARPRPRRAFVVTIGIDGYDEERLKLQFAASDARLLGERLASIPGYEVRRVTLAGEAVTGKRVRVTAAMIAQVVGILAGRNVATSRKALKQQGVDASKLEASTPDDIVILSFSGHGWADKTGAFYLVPAESKWPSGPEPVRSTLISAVQMADRLRDVDAGEMVMIIDACHSAASVDADGFKPGPMGDPGLGQLAFDKGIRILAATQADDVALEDALLRQGLLTYALASEGITATGGKADGDGDGRITLDEWLAYATRRMPSLASDVRLGRLATDSTGARGWVRTNAGASKPVVQEPSLFDFNSNPSKVVLREKVGP